MGKISKIGIALLVFIMGLNSCSQKNKKQEPLVATSLKSVFENKFYIGAAINDAAINEEDTLALGVLKRDFNSVSPENIMKWMYLHPTPDSFYFDMADKYVALGHKNDMQIVGHTLVWHSQIADWMLAVKDSAAMAEHLKKHIHTIVGRYKGRINSWDVVNEALNEDGTLRESLFLEVLGEGYIERAFTLAALADSQAELTYNDYNLTNPEKRAGVVKLVKQLQKKGIKIDAVGMQGHWSLIGPSIAEIENSIIAYSELGVKVSITELDITVLPNPWDLEGAEVSQNFEGSAFMNPYPNSLPDSIQVKLAKRYQDIFSLFLKHKDKIERVTFWGVNDGGSWLNNWPIKGRTNYPLLFDRQYRPKKAYDQLIELKK